MPISELSRVDSVAANRHFILWRLVYEKEKVEQTV
jgi:hypothetical protein